MKGSDMGRQWGILAFFALLALVMTYPLILNLDEAVVTPAEDPQLNSWIVAWDARALLTEPARLFHANIFHPYPYSLAYSENLLASALLGLPLQVLLDNPVLIYNVLTLLTFVLSGFGAYLLGRRLSGSHLAGLVAGVIFAFCPYRFGQLHHFQNLSAQWMPFALLFLDRVAERGERRDILLLALFTILQAWSSIYYTFFIAIGLALLALLIPLLRWWGDWRRVGQRVGQLAVAGGIAGVCIVPIFLPYARVVELFGAGRSLSYVTQLSPDALNYLAAPAANRLYGALTAPLRKEPEGALWPGALALGMAAFGGYEAFRGGSRRRTIWAGALIALALVAGALSLGPTIHLAGRPLLRGPYILLWRYLPGFQAVRVPARFAVLVMLALAGLAALGVQGLLARIPRAGQKWVAAGLLLVAVAEYVSIPLPVTPAAAAGPTPSVYTWLAGQPPDTAVVELPIDVYPDFEHDILYLGESVHHWRRLVNGYSGLFPAGYIALSKMLQDFPTQEGVDALRRLGVDDIIVHRDLLSPQMSASITPDFYTALEGITWLGTFGPAWVYRLTPPDAAFGRIALGTEAARPLLLKGWSPADDRREGMPFTWTLGEESYMLLPAWEGAGEIRILMQADLPDTHCQFTLNGRPLGGWDIATDQPEQYLLRPSPPSEPGLHILGWHCRAAEPPQHARSVGQTGAASPADLAVLAAGEGAGDYAAIYVEGKQYVVDEDCQACMQVALWPADAPEAPLWRTVNLAAPAEQNALAGWLMRFPERSIVAIAARPGAPLTLDVVRALAHYGGSGRVPADAHQGYIFIGTKGASLGTAVEEACREGCWRYLGTRWPDRRLAVFAVEAHP